MSHEIEITERLRMAIVEALEDEMMRGWSLDQLIPMLNNSVQDAIEEMQEEK